MTQKIAPLPLPKQKKHKEKKLIKKHATSQNLCTEAKYDEFKFECISGMFFFFSSISEKIHIHKHKYKRLYKGRNH